MLAVLWDEASRYVYFVVTIFILLPLKSKWDRWRQDNKELVKKVASLEQDISKVNDKQDNQADRFDKLEKRLDENQLRSDRKNETLLNLLNKIDKQTAVNTAKLEDSK